jgi:class 3 adenylate cyclase
MGSTSLAAKLDAEDWRDLVGAYLDDASKAVTGYGGYVFKKLGDGIMALFGYPRAQENDAERAARGGLAILRALEDLNACGDSAHAGGAEGADQQDRPQWRARHRSDDAGGSVSPGACEDATQPE